MKPLLIGFRRPTLINLFALTLCTSLILGSAVSGQAPTPQADPTQEIQQLAVDDVENDITRRPTYAKELYENASSGLTGPEIMQIYDNAYTEAQKEKKQGLRALLPDNGLLIPLLLIVGAVLGKLFEETLLTTTKKLIKAFNNWIYAQFAGNHFFRNIALQRYRAALLDKYKELKIPFRENQRPLLMNDVYVPLKVEGGSQRQLENIYTAINGHQRLMVKGPPGSGKSMLLKDIAFVYGDNRLTAIPDSPVPVLLELHRLGDAKLSQEQLIEALADVFKRNDFPNAEDFVKQGLENGALLLLLDGLDEVKSSARKAVAQSISDLLDTYESCRAIITCRTAVYQNEFATTTNQTLEVVEFSDQQIRQFLKAWKNDMPPEKSIDQLIQTLQQRPRIMALARNPLLLTIIAYLYSKPTFVLPHSRTDFYQEATRILLEQAEYKGTDDYKHNQYKASEKRTVLKQLALKHQELSLEQDDRRSISYTSALQQIRDILPSINRNPSQDTLPILQEISERSGLFIQIDKGENYQFSHLTLQEYFAAEALKQKPEQLVHYFQHDVNAWREVVKLWCGLEVDCTDLIQTVYAIDPLTGFECLADAKTITQSVADLIIEDFKQRIQTEAYSETLASAFGAVAADTRPRGHQVFSFLEDCLATDISTPAHMTAVNALAMTNSSAAVTALAKQYTNSHHIHTALVRMGDLAVPSLVGFLEQESVSAVDDLYSIGTPNAAKALVPALWHNNISMTSRAAWALAALLPKAEIEETLQTYVSLPASRVKQESYDWIWQPFNSSNGNLATIAGRIAYLLPNHFQICKPIAINTSLDLRIILPLCTIIHPLEAARIPDTLPKQTDTLLEHNQLTPKIEEQISKILNPVLNTIPDDSTWKKLLASLDLQLQLATLKQLIKNLPQTVEQRHWENIFKKSSYRFQTSWHYRCVLIIALVTSIMAIAGMAIFAESLIIDNSTSIGFLGVAAISIVTFWVALYTQDKKQSFAYRYFLKLGPLGLITFVNEVRNYWTYQPTWIGIQAIQKAQVT